MQEGPEPAAKVVDLMEALNASIAAAAKPGSEAKSTKRPAAKRGRRQACRPGQEGGQATGPGQARGPAQGLLNASARSPGGASTAAFPSGAWNATDERLFSCLESDPIHFPAQNRRNMCDAPIEPGS